MTLSLATLLLFTGCGPKTPPASIEAHPLAPWLDVLPPGESSTVVEYSLEQQGPIVRSEVTETWAPPEANEVGFTVEAHQSISGDFGTIEAFATFALEGRGWVMVGARSGDRARELGYLLLPSPPTVGTTWEDTTPHGDHVDARPCTIAAERGWCDDGLTVTCQTVSEAHPGYGQVTWQHLCPGMGTVATGGIFVAECAVESVGWRPATGTPRQPRSPLPPEVELQACDAPISLAEFGKRGAPVQKFHNLAVPLP